MKIRVEIVKNGNEIFLSANRDGLLFLAEVCEGLADEEYDPRRPPHFHLEPAMHTAEEGSVPLEIYREAD